MRIVARALQDERDNQVLFILKMPQQGSIETNNLSGKPFGRSVSPSQPNTSPESAAMSSRLAEQ
jgi:hypothetical protein